MYCATKLHNSCSSRQNVLLDDISDCLPSCIIYYYISLYKKHRVYTHYRIQPVSNSNICCDHSNLITLKVVLVFYKWVILSFLLSLICWSVQILYNTIQYLGLCATVIPCIKCLCVCICPHFPFYLTFTV